MTLKSDEEFHRQRRMFVCQREVTTFAPGSNDPRSHKEWFEAEGWPAETMNYARGFVDPTGVYLYCGEDYRISSAVIQAASSAHLHEALRRIGVLAGTPIYIGMTPQTEPGRWKPREFFTRTK